LEDNKIICIYGVDTRALTKKIRKNPSLKAVIEYSDNDSNEIALKDDLNSFDYDVDLVKSNSCQENYDFKDSTWDFTNGYSQQNDAHYKVVVIDYGVKKNILRYLNKYNLNVTVVPANTSYDDIKKLNPDGVLLSNGAGNPEQVINYTTDTIKKLIDSNIPILAICLGHQLLSMTLGCEIIKMQQGHRGCNHPVQDVNNRKVYITSQNHGYAVDSNKISSDVEVTHYSLFDNTIQGISVKNKKILSVQGHPESSSGPHDFEYIFQEFYNFIDKNK